MEIISGEWGKVKSFYLPFVTYGATDFKTGVTLAAGDVKISKDGGAFTNIATLPTIVGKWMYITLSAIEMQARNIAVEIVDQTATKVFEDTAATLSTNIKEWMQILFDIIESQRGSHTGEGEVIYWDPDNVTGLASDSKSGLSRHEPKLTYSYNTGTGVHSLLSNNKHQIIKCISGVGGGPVTVNEYINIDKAYTFMRADGRDFLVEATHNQSEAVLISAEGCEISGMRIKTKATGSQDALTLSGGFARVYKVFIDYSRGSGILIDNSSNNILDDFLIQDSAQGGSGHALHILGDTTLTERNLIGTGRIFSNGNGGGGADGIRIDGANCIHNFIHGGTKNLIVHDNTGWGINEVNGADETIVVGPTVHFGHNDLGQVNLTGVKSTFENVEQWATAVNLATLQTSVDAIPTQPVTVVSALDGTVQSKYAVTVDMTGKRLYFGAKKQAGDSEYSIAVKEITSGVTNAAAGQGTIPLTSSDLAIAPADYDAEVEMRDSDGTSNPITILKFQLRVVEQVIV